MKANPNLQNFKSLFVAVILFACYCFAAPYQLAQTLKPKAESRDSVYSDLTYCGVDHIPSSAWTKSVVFNPAGTKLYSLNLEEMSIYEFDSFTKSITRRFKFKATPAAGWNYQLNRPMPSHEEKPVEGCFSHDGKILWVSLHNAGGIVAIRMDSTLIPYSLARYPTKTLFVYDIQKRITDTMAVPFISTGKTPKVIAVTSNNKFLLVSNWHSNSVSVIRINDSVPPYGKKVKDIRTGALPRGIAISNERYPKTYVTNMGTNVISVINNRSWRVERNIHTSDNPRHIISSVGRLYASYNTPSEIACFNSHTNRILFKSSTSAHPRTITLSENQKFLFVACYEGNSIDVFKINKGNFKRIYSIKCNGKPVGIDLREDLDTLEAWVCTYNGNTLQVFTFEKT